MPFHSCGLASNTERTWTSRDTRSPEGAVVAVVTLVAPAESPVALAMAVALIGAHLLRAFLAGRAVKTIVHAMTPAHQ